MATYHIAPPEKFTFAQPDEWPRWIQRFERFRVASGLQEKTQETQVNTLVYSMGTEAEDILHSFTLTEAQRKDYTRVVSKFEEYFVKKRIIIYERAKFNQRKQNEGESVDMFITSLHSLAEHCSYGNLKEEMIRDRIVVGLLDTALSEKLQLDSDLTLEKAMTSARQREMVGNQQILLRNQDQPAEIEVTESVKKKMNSKSRPHHPKHHNTVLQSCAWCGKRHSHGREHCPAKATELKWQQKNCQEDVYVIEKLQRPLIGSAIERLGLE